MSVIVLLISLFFSSVWSQEWIVHTEYGDVRGYWSEQYQVWRFVGIPYAKPPVGELRYKVLEPPSPWTGVLDAINDTITCHSSQPVDGYPESEDCLVINVFIPESVRLQGSTPVLFFTHGGGFIFGSGNGYNPFHTTRHDVILITFNYRLGPLGFLCLGTERVPGNAGVKDAITALRWVQKNIAGFGGDPNSITLYGESAGAVVVEALVLSKAAVGLFHRVIIESGSVLSTIADYRNRLGFAKALAISFGLIPVDDDAKLENFYEDVDAQELTIKASEMSVRSLVRLCIEKEIDGVEAVAVENFPDILTSGDYVKVPMLYAFAELDGMGFTTSFYETIEDMNNDFEKYIPIDLAFPSSAVKDDVVNKIKSFYFGANPIDDSDDSLLSYIYYETDIRYMYSIIQSALLNSENSNNPIYLMEFSYRGGFNQPNIHTQFPIAGHADIVAHVMDLGHSNNETIEQDQIIRDTLTEIWTNFVKYSDPTPVNGTVPIRWLPLTRSDQHYLNVNSELSLRQFPHAERMQFWDEVYQLYYQPPPKFQDLAASAADSRTGSTAVILIYLFTYYFINI